MAQQLCAIWRLGKARPRNRSDTGAVSQPLYGEVDTDPDCSEEHEEKQLLHGHNLSGGLKRRCTGQRT